MSACLSDLVVAIILQYTRSFSEKPLNEPYQPAYTRLISLRPSRQTRKTRVILPQISVCDDNTSLSLGGGSQATAKVRILMLSRLVAWHTALQRWFSYRMVCSFTMRHEFLFFLRATFEVFLHAAIPAALKGTACYGSHQRGRIAHAWQVFFHIWQWRLSHKSKKRGGDGLGQSPIACGYWP